MGEDHTSDDDQVRRSERKAVETEFRLGDESGFGEIVLDTHDLSSGGAFLRADLLFEVGEEIDLEFGLPHTGRVIRARGRVAWVTRGTDDDHPAGMGIEFVGLDPADHEALVDYLGS